MTCVWEPDPACLSDEWQGLDEAVRQRSLLLATSSLQMLTLNRVGTCPITIRPCPEKRSCGCSWAPVAGVVGVDDGFGTGTFGSVAFGEGVWANPCSHSSWCRPLSEVDIPGPVGYIEQFLIDGEPVDLWENNNWRLDDGHLLVWQGDGPSPVPSTQDLNKSDSEPGTWSITYSRSYPVGPDARLAVAYLAMEFAEACKPRGKCKLPRGVTNVVRNGVTFTIQAGLFPNGLTNIDMVDQFILKWAPAGAPSRNAQVMSPRSARSRTRVSSGVPSRYTGSV